MTKDPFAALQRHFEEQYGKLGLSGSRKKKQKRGHLDPDPQEEALESEEEWLGVERDLSPSTHKPTVITFTENEDVTEEAPMVTLKSFMVTRALETF